jgi:3,4-dihydroxy 2-butanone 4-phosphate synthase / GTP cyclohydrolase II
MSSLYTFAPFEEVLASVRAGKMVIMVDSPSRENEGDIVIPSQFVTPEHIAFMASAGRGLICVSLSKSRAFELNLPPQVPVNQSSFGTAFTISIDHSSVFRDGATAAARCHTIRRLVSADAIAEEFIRPGHVFPLVAHDKGTFGRSGQTEGSVDLALLAGCFPSGVICEILNDDGTMARGDSLIEFAKKHCLLMTSVEEVRNYRRRHSNRAELRSSSRVFLGKNEWLSKVYEDSENGQTHFLMSYGEVDSGEPILVRVHSECLTGDVFRSRRCDCGDQLTLSLRMIQEQGSGMVVYLRQEGRGIGLINKLKAYVLQDQGKDTVEANLLLGFEAEPRDFAIAAHMLLHAGVRSVRCLTNNPQKIRALQESGIKVVERVPVSTPIHEVNRRYVETKREKLGHLI